MGSAENNSTDGELFSLQFETAFKSAFIVSKPRVCLGKHQININQFELGRNVRGGEAMAVISVDQDISKDILDELISNDGIISVRKIVL